MSMFLEKSNYASKDIKQMSTSDLKLIAGNDTESTFGEFIKMLESVKTSLIRMKSGKGTEQDTKRLKHFGYGWAGWDELWSPYMRGDYGICVKVVDEAIRDLKKKTNNARITWLVGSGVLTELKRRGHHYGYDRRF